MIQQVEIPESERRYFQLKNPFAQDDPKLRFRQSIESIAGAIEPQICAGETVFLIPVTFPLYGVEKQIDRYFHPGIKLKYFRSYPQQIMVCVQQPLNSTSQYT
jgi:hypothetical protein